MAENTGHMFVYRTVFLAKSVWREPNMAKKQCSCEFAMILNSYKYENIECTEELLFLVGQIDNRNR